MPSEVMDQRRMSLLSDELRFPTERQVGFWKPELVSDSRGIEGMPLLSWSNLSNSVSLSPMEKLHPIGPSSRERRELSQQYLFKDQKAEHGLENHLVGGGSVNSWRASDQDFGLRSDLSVGPSTVLMGGNKVDMNQINFENSLFSSSLSDLLDRNLKLSSNVASLGQSINTMTSNLEEEDPLEYSEEIEAHAIGNLLPDDDDDLFSGVIEDIGYVAEPNPREEIDDDIFCSGGDIELGDSDRVIGGLDSPLASEHPFGEHPSRTLFVRNINSNIEDSELRMLFQQYGDIRTLYTACKHRGFVMISYHDIRAARTAIKLLQNKLFKGRKLDIHFSIPKENPSDKDINQGTLVIFNLDSSVSNDDLLHIFGVYGEIKEIRETPHKRHHKFVEFYDIRAAEAALRALNRRDIAGKKIKLEPSRSGGSRRGLLQQLSPELELEESSGSRQNISPSSSPIGSKGFIPLGTTASGFDNVLVHRIQSAAMIPSNSLSQINSLVGSSFHGISSVTSVGNHSEPGHSFGPMELGFQGMPVMTTGIPYNSSSIMPGMAINIASQPVEGVDKKYIHRVGSGSLTSRSFDHNEGAYGGPGNGSCPVQGPPYMWNNSNASHHFVGPILWGNSSFMNNIPSLHPQHMCRLPRAPSHMLNPALPVHGTPHVGPAPSVNPPLHGILHVGSAPSVNPPPLYDWRQLFIRDHAELPALHASSLGSGGFPHNSQTGPLELAPHNTFIHAKGNGIDHVGISSPHQRGHMLNVRTRRSDPNANVVDNKKQFELDVDRIIHGEDSRTTLMIKNIPNKYTSKMLLASIDEHHKGTYNFIYLPIDFKNKCNVGYAFINMIEPQQIIPFFQAFNGKKWEKFNSEKVAVLAYARIQGKAALITHFQNSSLMNEDKRCRPILFCSDGPNAGDQEPFPMGTNIRSRPGRSKTFINEESNEGSPSTSPTQADLASSSKILE